MSPEHEEPELIDADAEQDDWGDEAPRSIFSALWFRVILVVLVLGVVGAVAIPYMLERASTTTTMPTPPAARSASSDKPSTSGASTPSSEGPAVPAPTTSSTPAPVVSGAPAPQTAAPARPATPAPAPVTPAPAPAATSPVPTAEPHKTVAAARGTDAPATPVDPTHATGTRSTTTVTSPPASGAYWVQVGAFKDIATAKRVATTLREQKYQVQESVKGGRAAPATPTAKPAPADAGDRYELHVAGGTDVKAKLDARGLAANPEPSGFVVGPGLPLPAAVSLSKDLAADGMRVQVRRAAGGAQTATPVESTVTTPGAETVYRVRVGGFLDRKAALVAVQDLEAKGYKAWVGSGQD
jgi:hypothetical protein